MKELIITSSVLIVVIATIRLAFRGYINPRLQYALWGLVLIRLLLPVSLSASPVSVLNTFGTVSVEQTGMQPNVSVGHYDTDYAAKSDIIEHENVKNSYYDFDSDVNAQEIVTADLSQTAETVWYCGIAAMALCLIWSNLRFYIILRRTRQRIVIEGVNETVYVAEQLPSSCLFGLLHPAVYITPEVAADETMLGNVMAHELTHRRHLDNLWSAMRCLCLTIHWYNPLVWLAAILSKRDAELACDEATIKKLGEQNRISYGRTLISLTTAKGSPANLLRCATTMTLGKKGMKERIMFIANKPKMVVPTIIAVFLIVAVTVGCTFTGKEDESDTAMAPTDFTLSATAYIRLMDGAIYNANECGCGCYSDENNAVHIYYDNGEATVTAPIELFESNAGGNNFKYDKTGFFISPAKTAIAYGTMTGKDPINILISDDKGQNWSTSTIDGELMASWISIGFSSVNVGWLIVCGEVAMGNEEHNLYITSDGGKTWKYVDSNIEEVYGRVLSGAGFANSDTGFMCFRYENAELTVCVTHDGGQTWKKINIQLPEEYSIYNATPLSPVFDGTVTILPLMLASESDLKVGVIYLESEDYGETWSVREYEAPVSDEEAEALFAKSTGNIHDYIPDMIAGKSVSHYDLLPCLENFTHGTWSELEDKYSQSKWFSPLFTDLFTDMRNAAVGSGQYLRDYYIGCAYLASDGAFAEGLSDIIAAQWAADSALYAQCLREKFTEDDADTLSMMMCYALIYQSLNDNSVTFGSESTVSLTNYPEFFPFSRYGEDKKVTSEENKFEEYGVSTTLECGGRRLSFLSSEEGVYYLYEILSVATGDMANGIAVGDRAEEVEKTYAGLQLIKIDSFAGDDYFGKYDEVWVYKPDDSSHKYIAYVIMDGYVRGIQSIDGLDKDVY